MEQVEFCLHSDKEEPVFGMLKFVDLGLSVSPCGVDARHPAPADRVVFSCLRRCGGFWCGGV